MKKRVIALVTAAVMVFAMGCGKKAPAEVPAETIPVADRTVAEHLMYDFEAQVKADEAVSAMDVATKLTENEIVYDFGFFPMEIEEGLLNGFDNAEIKGFSEGALFAPMIGSIPFVGYVFTLSDGTDADAFVQTLKDNANPRWNICTEAEQTLVDKVGNKVLFVMSPKSFDDEF